MSALAWLIAANAALWIGLGLFAARLASALKTLERRVSQLEDIHE